MKVGSLIITYNPQKDLLAKVIESLEMQVELIIIVDNGNSDIFEDSFFTSRKKIVVKQLGKNMGIATATNTGFEIAKEKQLDYILLSDQDTTYLPDYIKKFENNYLEDDKIIAYAPCIVDLTSNTNKPVYQLENNKIVKVFPDSNCIIFQTIASGLIINLSILNKVGGMNEKLFIDYVDFEWCWKVNHYGYHIMYVKDMLIHHQLGDNTQYLLGKKIAKRSPVRYYYIIRNTLYLAKNTEYLSHKTKKNVYLEGLKYFIGYLIKSSDKKIIFRAFKDYKKNRLGEYGN